MFKIIGKVIKQVEVNSGYSLHFETVWTILFLYKVMVAIKHVYTSNKIML